MNDVHIDLTLPQNVVEPLVQIAKASGKPLDEVVLQCIKGGMPPSLRKVPDSFHAELLALNGLEDMQLWQVIQGELPPKKKPSSAQEKADFETLRRAYAYSLLKWRGHPVPIPQELLIE